jgi:hypothetical protein
MGRGGGNPTTEALVTVLLKKGIDLGINYNQLMDIGERLIKPLLQDKGWDSINITSGYAGFHSGYLKTILSWADKSGVDPRDLIVGLCKVDQVNAPEELVGDIARRLQKQQAGKAGLKIVALPRLVFPKAARGDSHDDSLSDAARKVASEVRSTAKKLGKQGVFNIVAPLSPFGRAKVSRFVQEEFGFVIGSAEVDNQDQMHDIVAAVDGIVDIFLVDSELKPYLKSPLTNWVAKTALQSLVLGYKDSDVWVRSVDHQIGAMLQRVPGRRIIIYGTDNLALKLAWLLTEQGAEVVLAGDVSGQAESWVQAIRQMALGQVNLRLADDPIAAVWAAEVLVSFGKEMPISQQMVAALNPQCIIFDAGIGAVSPEAVRCANEREIRIVRPDMRVTLSSELASLLGTEHMVHQIMGRGELAGVPIVAGGLIGHHGDIVVDSITNPQRVLGVADGHGLVIYDHDPEFTERLAQVEQEIMRRQIQAR